MFETLTSFCDILAGLVHSPMITAAILNKGTSWCFLEVCSKVCDKIRRLISIEITNDNYIIIRFIVMFIHCLVVHS